MSTKEQIILITLAVNFMIALLYLIWGLILAPLMKKKGRNYNRGKYVIYFFVIQLCPVIGLLYFGAGYLMFRLFFHQEADLSDLKYQKKNVLQHVGEDKEGAINLAPMEEALAVSDKSSLRTLMMSVIKGDVQKSLSAISLALNSGDSETSHYAASVLRDEMNDFRENVQKICIQINNENGDRAQDCCLLLEYMNGMLAQKVFVPMEQEYYVNIMEETGETLLALDRKRITATYYEWICLRLLDIHDYDRAIVWGNRAYEDYPNELSSYTCLLKTYFNLGDRDSFFLVLQKVKNTNVVFDNETLELIRIFQ